MSCFNIFNGCCPRFFRGRDSYSLLRNEEIQVGIRPNSGRHRQTEPPTEPPPPYVQHAPLMRGQQALAPPPYVQHATLTPAQDKLVNDIDFCLRDYSFSSDAQQQAFQPVIGEKGKKSFSWIMKEKGVARTIRPRLEEKLSIRASSLDIGQKMIVPRYASTGNSGFVVMSIVEKQSDRTITFNHEGFTPSELTDWLLIIRNDNSLWVSIEDILLHEDYGYMCFVGGDRGQTPV